MTSFRNIILWKCYHLGCFIVLQLKAVSLHGSSSISRCKILINLQWHQHPWSAKWQNACFRFQWRTFIRPKKCLPKTNLSFHTFHWVTGYGHCRSTWWDHILGKSEVLKKSYWTTVSPEHAEWWNVPIYRQNGESPWKRWLTQIMQYCIMKRIHLLC
jgi:hypothetical protein